MKMDSYRRFVRSPLYQSCTLAGVEGKPLPHSDRMGSWEDMATRSSSLGGKKVEWREGVQNGDSCVNFAVMACYDVMSHTEQDFWL